jgi:xanthine dehydrogenase YagS FAD-binding subunit
MRPFEFQRVGEAARASGAAQEGGVFVGGGTTMYDLMKLDVLRPHALVDVTGISGLAEISLSGDELRIGALVSMAKLAADAKVAAAYPVLVETLTLAASQQLRNMARLGGNVLQRTRCSYFRDTKTLECNKRVPGSGCAAMDGNNKSHAILGGSSSCIATYPGDWAQALIALDADVEILGAGGERVIKFSELHCLPGDTPHIETNLHDGDLITGFVIKGGPWPRSRYVKVRDRESYEFGLATAAVALRLDGDVVSESRIALGGVATVPWRAKSAEVSLQGRALNEIAASEAAEAAFLEAKTYPLNAYKLALGKAVLIRALLEAKEMAA